MAQFPAASRQAKNLTKRNVLYMNNAHLDTAAALHDENKSAISQKPEETVKRGVISSGFFAQKWIQRQNLIIRKQFGIILKTKGM